MNAPLTDCSHMPFGKHKGKLMESVPAQYLAWLYAQSNLSQAAVHVIQYIESRRPAIDKELDEQGQMPLPGRARI